MITNGLLVSASDIQLRNYFVRNCCDLESLEVRCFLILHRWHAISNINHGPISGYGSRRDAQLIAIARARQWVEELAHGHAASFAAIARREGKAERHARLLAPLAFVSPRIVAAILDGTAPAGITVTALARARPWCWAEQERQVGI